MIIAGAGLTGATCARILAERGQRVTVYERRSIGGLCTDTSDGVPSFGPHIFHTDDEEVWKFVNRFAAFDDYRHQVMALTDIGLVPWPPNDETRERCGDRLFELCIESYSKKMWGEVPGREVLDRITYNQGDCQDFFPDKYQGRPIHGYTRMIQTMLNHENISLSGWSAPGLANGGIWTGTLSRVPYREVLFTDIPQSGPEGVVNICTPALPFTRVSRYPTLTQIETPGIGIPCYPLKEGKLAAEKAKNRLEERGWIPAGRMGGYEYLDMDDAVRGAIDLCECL